MTNRENIASKESQVEYNYSVPYFSTDIAYEGNGLIIASQAIMENRNGENILLLEIVNKSDDAVGVSTTNIDINGLRVCNSTWSYDTINPGKTAIVDINLSSVLEPEYWDVYGIAGVGNVALKVCFKDNDNNEVATPAYLSVDIPGVDAVFSMEGAEVYNDNGIRIVSKGVYADPSEYSDDLHILVFAENTSGKTLDIDDVYDSLSVNEYMTAYSFYTTIMEDGTCAMIDICLQGYGLEDINITEPSEIQSVEFSIIIRDQNYKKIDEATILIEAAEEVEAEEDNSEVDGIRPEFKETMDSYEAFFDEYVVFMQEYKEADDVMAMLGDYTDMMVRYAEAMSALEQLGEEELSEEETIYYAEVMSRITKKLLKATE